jgi:ATP-dependent exoDNAse (exonuclease V) beta subunit
VLDEKEFFAEVEGIIPERETIKAEQNGQKELIEEERRLFYLGMTRTKRHLPLCSVDYYHQKRVKVSRFVREVSLVLSGKNPQEISKNEEPTLSVQPPLHQPVNTRSMLSDYTVPRR